VILKQDGSTTNSTFRQEYGVIVNRPKAIAWLQGEVVRALRILTLPGHLSHGHVDDLPRYAGDMCGRGVGAINASEALSSATSINILEYQLHAGGHIMDYAKAM